MNDLKSFDWTWKNDIFFNTPTNFPTVFKNTIVFNEENILGPTDFLLNERTKRKIKQTFEETIVVSTERTIYFTNVFTMRSFSEKTNEIEEK